jgi:metal transporter CNNM
MSLDLSGLEIVMASEDAALARSARAIYPVRKNGNLLLCTLLLGNVAVNSLLSILMADLTSGLVGFLSSTIAIVVFGEIIPQAICSRFPLQVGEKAVPIVKVFIVLLAAVAWPLAFILNKVLGREIGTTYSSAEMTKLIELHVRGGHFDHETGAAMTGALRYHGMSVRDVMTPLHNTFMLSSDEKLGFDTVAKIFKTGYSRIPVYEVTKSNVIGLLFVKDLIFLDPEDEIPVKNFVQIFGRGLHIVWPEDKLGHVLKILKKGRSHMALVRDVNHGDGTLDPFYEIKGIITLEDIIEIILGDEIVDETDELVEVNDPGELCEYLYSFSKEV